MEWVSQVRVGDRTDKAVLVALANYHQQKNDDCCPGIDTIAGFAEINRKTVMPALDRLMDAGFITFEKGSRRYRKYTLHFDALVPAGGTIKKRDNRANLKPKDDPVVPTTGTMENAPKSQNEPANVPTTGTKEPDPKVPKLDSQSPKTDVLKSQPLDHKQDNGTNGNNPPSSPPLENSAEDATDLLGDSTDQPGKPKRFVAAEIPLPSGVNREAWLAWCQYRSRKRKPVSEDAAPKLVAKFLNYSPEDQQVITDHAIESDYQGWFPPKELSHARPQPGAGRNPDTRRLSGVERTRLAREQQRQRERSGTG